MKTPIKFFVTFCLFILLVSCSQKNKYENATFFDMTDFKTTQILNGTILQFDSIIMKPSQLQIYDTLLITSNLEDQKIFHIFNLNTKRKIGERISRGQGPEEMLLPFFIQQKDSIKIFDMMTSTLFVYTIQEFVTNPIPNPIRKIKLDIQPLWSELALLKNKMIGVSYAPKSPCFLFDENGKKIKDFGSYPVSQIEYTDIERVDAFRSILTSNQTNRVAICHYFTDLIDIYNDNGELIKRLHGPEHFFPHFKEYKNGDIIGSKPIEKTYKDAFYSPTNVGDEFFVLYNGKLVGSENYNLLAQQILVFTWEGNPLRILHLDQGVSRISVDPNQKKIYGISDDPEFHIIEFSYK